MTTLTDFSGFDLALGSVYAVRWFQVDPYGRLRGIHHNVIWKPGENVAVCRKDEPTTGSGWFNLAPMSFTFTSLTVTSADEDEDEEPTPDRVDLRFELAHDVPDPSCTCGFYAYAEGCNNENYHLTDTICGVVECYGRTIIGTKGLRAEKARIVALATDREKVRRLYPDVKFYGARRNWCGQRVPGRPAMLRDFTLVERVEPTPETDPSFWGES